MSRILAILWDVDGTLAETERDGHRVAFNHSFERAGLPWRWSVAQYGELLSITGGRERLLHFMKQHSDGPPLAAEREALARQLHLDKNRIYAELLAEVGIPLRPGVIELIREARDRGLRQGLVTTTSRSNVDALLRLHLGADWADGFEVRICGEDVRSMKPDPEAYLLALERLGLGPLEAVAIEDSPGGVGSAREAGVPVVVTPSEYFDHSTIEGAIAIGPGLHTRAGWRPGLAAPAAPGAAPERVTLDDLLHWCADMDSVSQFG